MLNKYSYRVTWSEDDQEFVGLCAEFPSLSWLDPSQDAAFAGIRKLVSNVLLDMENNGEDIPTPISLLDFSGKFMVRVPPELHRELTLRARCSKVSLNRYIASKLAQF